MEPENQTNNLNKKHPQHVVHKTLAQSYFTYFLLLILGVLLDLFFPIRVFHNTIMISVGFVLLVFATFLIIWAQHTSRKLDIQNLTKESFCKGPYCYTRTPTNYGLLFLVLGFGFILNAFSVIVFTIVAFVIARLGFLKKQEKILADRYGQAYQEYKKIVKF